MQFNLERDPRTHTIVSHSPGQVTISVPWREGDDTPLLVDVDGQLRGRIRHETFTSSLVVTPEHLIRDWPPQTLTEITRAHFEDVASLTPEVVLFGSGARLWWPPIALLEPLVQHGIGIEVMDTAAACRTYNILVYEGRNVAAALLMN
ncbi:MAG: Mth938-like domain-containing protein [Pseudomonadota bacterium]